MHSYVQSTRQDLVAAAIRVYQSTFDERPAVVAGAPGRVNLIGEHTDYNEGFVLPVAIDRFLVAAAGPRNDNQLVMYSRNFESIVHAQLAHLRPGREDAWSNYVKGVAFFLRRNAFPVTGANIAIIGNIPGGSGLSSSAALEVSVCSALTTLSGTVPAPLERIKLCQQAENEFVGVSCGIMDQFISTLGRRDHALLLDCRSLEYEHTPFPGGTALLVCHTGLQRNLASSEYNKRRQECFYGVRLLAGALPEIRALRDVPPPVFDEHAGLLPEPVLRRCRHVVTENARVALSTAALRRGDLATFGTLMADSHRSLKDDFEVSCPELDAVVDICLEIDGVYGARMTGAGFGGSAICLAREDAAGAVMARLAAEYPRRTGRTPLLLRCAVEDGVTTTAL